MRCDHRRQHVAGDRLADEIVEAGRTCARLGFGIGTRSQGDQRGIQATLAHLLRQRHAVQAGQVEIEEGDVERGRRDLDERGEPMRRVGDAVPFAETAAEGTALSATTDPQNFPLASGSQVLSFESRARQNDSIANAYRATWSCKKSTSSGIEQWPSSGTRTTPPSVATDRDFLTIGAGEFIDCTVTYTPPYLTLKKAVDQAGTAAADLPAAWKLTATDAAGVSLVNGVANGTKTAVVPGTYTLSEAAGTTSWRYGYRWSGLSCTGAGVNATLNRDEATDTVRDASVSVAAGGDVTCTFTNTANEPRLDLTKTAFYQGAEFGSGRTIGTDDPGTPGPGSTITYALTFDNSKGTAAIAVDHIDYLRAVLDAAD